MQTFSLVEKITCRHARTLTGLVSFLCMVTFCQTTLGHPVPDVPVRSTFSNDGTVTIRVEVDPRCFASDPLNEPYLQNVSLHFFDKKKRAELLSKTEAFIKEFIEFQAQPGGQFQPEFKMKFTTFANKDLTWNSDKPAANTLAVAQTPVVVTAEWKTDASLWSGYQIKSSKKAKLSVHFVNEVNGKEQPLNVLFPGEESYKLDLTSWTKTVAANSAKTNKE